MKLKNYIKYKIKNKLEPIEFKFIFLLVSKVLALSSYFYIYTSIYLKT